MRELSIQEQDVVSGGSGHLAGNVIAQNAFAGMVFYSVGATISPYNKITGEGLLAAGAAGATFGAVGKLIPKSFQASHPQTTALAQGSAAAAAGGLTDQATNWMNNLAQIRQKQLADFGE